MKRTFSALLLVVAACVGVMASPSPQTDEIAVAAPAAAPVFAVLDLDAMPPTGAAATIEPNLYAMDHITVAAAQCTEPTEPVPRSAKRVHRARVLMATYQAPGGRLVLST